VVSSSGADRGDRRATADASARDQVASSAATGGPAVKRTGICGTVVYNPGASAFESKPASTEILVLDSSGMTVAETRSDDRGRYDVALEPGTYRVLLPKYGVVVAPVVVEAGVCLDANLTIDAPGRGRGPG